MFDKTLSFLLPDTLKNWPWPRRINKHHDEAKAESDDWFRSFNAFTPESQKAFDRCDFSLLASLSYINLSKEQLRTACDMTNLFFVFDEYTDSVEGHVARQYADAVIDALRNPFKERPEGEVVLGTIAQEFWALGVQTASVTSQRRFVETFIEYANFVVRQAEYRDLKRIPTVEEYLGVRRGTIGVYPSFSMIELPYDLPDEVFDNEVVKDLARFSRDLIILDNDILSYNKEQASEEIPHNIITVVMHHSQCDLHEAVDIVAAMHKETSDAFLARWQDLPVWDPSIADMAADYVEGIANWVRSNNAWHFESGRYFGDKSKEVEKSRLVALLPKRLGLGCGEQLRVTMLNMQTV